MLESLVITLREGVGAPLVVGLTLSFLERTGRRDLKPAVWHALGLAILGSVVGALLLQSVISVRQEVVEGALMLAAAIFVGAAMIWMRRDGRPGSSGTPEAGDPPAAGHGEAWALGLFVFFMVMREGAEALLLLSAISVSSSGLPSLLGACVGIGLATLLAGALFRAAIQLDLDRFLATTTVVLGVLVVELLLQSYHQLAKIGLLPANQSTMAIVGPAVEDSIVLVPALLAPLMLVFLATCVASGATTGAGAPGPGIRESWSEVFRRKAGPAAFVVLGALVIGLLVFDHLASRAASEPGRARRLGIEDGVVTVPIEGLDVDTQHLFVVDVSGRPVRFFVWMLGHDPRVCLDACETCGSMGYAQEGHQLTCINCGAGVYPPSLGQPGGCNPIPLPFTLRDGSVTISRAALAASSAMF